MAIVWRSIHANVITLTKLEKWKNEGAREPNKIRH